MFDEIYEYNGWFIKTDKGYFESLGWNDCTYVKDSENAYVFRDDESIEDVMRCIPKELNPVLVRENETPLTEES